MPRRLKVSTREAGFLELYLIYEYNGRWEEEWAALQGEEISSLLTVVSEETMSHCLHGWTSPFFKALGLPPYGSLLKLPTVAKECANRKKCSLYDRNDCLAGAKKMPWCFEPDGLDSEEKRRLGAELIKLWREGVYVVVVQEDVDAR